MTRKGLIRRKTKSPINQIYLFILKDLLLKSLKHVENVIDITREQMKIILTCRKSILSNKSTWIKKKLHR